MTEPVTFDRLGRMPRLSDTIAEQLLEAIVDGRFREGDVLPSERELGDQFGVSRTVIREAVRALATRGVVEVQSGRGVRVVAPDTTSVTEAMSLLMRGGSAIDFAKVHEIRMMLEIAPGGRGGGAQHAGRPRRARAAPGRSGPTPATTSTPRRAWTWTSTARSPSARATSCISSLLDSIAGALLENRRATLALEHSHAKVLAEHRAVVDAIKQHDPEGARRAMDTHLEGVAEAWRTRSAAAARDGAD